jgi:hypothetical protein
MLTWRGPTCGAHMSVGYISISGTVATISKIFQKLYLFHMISDEDDFYIKKCISRRDLQLSSFEFFNLRSLKCSKKLNKFSTIY